MVQAIQKLEMLWMMRFKLLAAVIRRWTSPLTDIVILRLLAELETLGIKEADSHKGEQYDSKYRCLRLIVLSTGDGEKNPSTARELTA